MKTENNKLGKVNSAIAFIVFLLMSFSSIGQCDLACNGAVQVSLDNDCSVEITVDMVFEGTPTVGCVYTVTLEDAQGNPVMDALGNPVVTAANIGQTLSASISDGNGNSCWGTITVEDKLAPSWNCPDDVVVLCYDDIDPYTETFMANNFLVDNCENAIVTKISDNLADIDCNAPMNCNMSYASTLGLPWAGTTLDAANPSCTAVTDLIGDVGVVHKVVNVTIGDGEAGNYYFSPGLSCSYVMALYPNGGYDNANPCNTSNLLAFGYNIAGGSSVTMNALLDENTEYDIVLWTTDQVCMDAMPSAVNQTCTGISARRTICYVAVDASGNTSPQCCYDIVYARINLYDAAGDLNVDFPADVNLNCSNTGVPGSLSDWDGRLDSDDVPLDGVPEITLGSFPIFPNLSYCELNATYTDIELDLCGAEYKIIREWTVLDWCTGEIVKHNQIIKVEQDPLNVTTEFGNYDDDTEPYTCTGCFTLPDVSANHGQIANATGSGLIVGGICSGTDWTYEVYYLDSGQNPGDTNNDGSINSADCPDSFPGIFTKVGGTYTKNQKAEVCNLQYGCNWVKYVITTECGEVNEITVEVFMFDNTPPNPVCDQHTVVTVGPNGWAVANAESFDDGSFDFCSDVTFGVRRVDGACNNTADLTPLSTTYGGNTYYTSEKFCCSDIGSAVNVELIVIDESGNWNVCNVEAIVQDITQPTFVCPPTTVVQNLPCGTGPLATTAPTFTGSICVNDYVVTMDDDSDPYDVEDCGDYKVDRTWRVRLGSATGTIVRTCNVTIEVRNTTIFNGNTGINWPDDITDNNGCMASSTDPSTTGNPVYNGGNCSLLAHTYTDQVFPFVDNSCFKILRTWTVIDWCQYNTATPQGPGIWQHVQVIKINDTTAPNPIAEDQTIDILNKQAAPNGCRMMGGVSVNGNDNCGDLTYSYSISPYPGFTATGGPSTNNSVEGIWNEGTYVVTWTVEDACGNTGTTTQNVFVEDKIAPTPYCIGSITTVLMESTGEIDIWASDFDLGTTDNCDTDITATFGNGQTSITFDCSHLGVQTLQVYFTDDAGNSDFCTVEIDIQDNLNACGTNPRIAGDVYTEMNEKIEDAEVMLHQMSDETFAFDMTNYGSYMFDPIQMNSDYEISASKDVDYMNGVSTLDLVIMQKHILNIQKLNSAYKVMAADVNNSGNISAIDLVELRKLILGIYLELPSNDSWRFVDATQSFADLNDPWPFVEVIHLDNVNSSMMSNDFIAVKIGDVNNTAAANFDSQVTENRSSTKLQLVALSQTEDNVETIQITADNFEDILGMQTTFEIANKELESVEAGALAVTTANFNTAVKNKLAFSWNTTDALSISKDEVLFTLVLRAKTNNTYNASLLTISSDITNTEAYNKDLEVMEINLRNGSNDAENPFEVYQNTPNPFSDNTSISFNLPERASVTLSFFDITGKVINEWTKEYNTGMNTVEITPSELNAKGVIYYRIDTGSHTATKKMISL